MPEPWNGLALILLGIALVVGARALGRLVARVYGRDDAEPTAFAVVPFWLAGSGLLVVGVIALGDHLAGA